ncbi:hypothetical protein N4T42_02235 [Riemerella anatipestifer]|uniref:hypothetical protein n=1 Tax=Riemerella anatipestifer TaxID=34085 RepID=UPI0021D5C23B|nr:hypothetical protein [Riemerella anatipestifer]MCU7559121.1 hypothetical protein [Riemerella anatipestifer]MDY3317509.1 hypothetical protein [Riemerella anatipestifer]MDY3400693.1 hypothetical protein [Riemerella anatipestifer]
MKLFENYKVVKTTEYAFLIEAFVEEMDKKIQFWLPKAKVEENDNTLSVEQETWDKKLEELKNPPAEEYVWLYVYEYEEMEKAYKIILSASLQKISLNPWAFLPKSQVAEIEELPQDAEDGKFRIKVKKWLWEKTLDSVTEHQLEFFNKDKEDENKFSWKDFELQTKVEE